MNKVVLVVLDGVGTRAVNAGNAVAAANMPNIRRLWQEGVTRILGAAGVYVGKLPGETGDSEVGHLTMGSGKIIKQDSVRVTELLESGQLFDELEWKETVAWVKERGSVLHFSGLSSDETTHGDIRHLYLMLERAADEGVEKVRVHLILDGRDTPPQSALEYVDELERRLAVLRERGLDYRVADGIGREWGVMDRYYADVARVERGYRLWVYGEGRQFGSAREAIETVRGEQPEIQDQFFPEFVVVSEAGEPVGLIHDEDALIFYNFRADRAIEIAEVFDSPAGWYSRFDLGKRPEVRFVGMTEYDEDQNIPRRYFVKKPNYDPVLMEVLQKAGVRSFATSESFKYGHITFYFDGLRKEPFYGETAVEVKSGPNLLQSRPWMECAEITDVLIEALPEYDFCRVNYTNGDMLGHIADMESSVLAMEAVDLQMGRVMEACKEAGAVLVVTADHGNIEEIMYEDGSPKTAHTTNPVPFTIWGVAGSGGSGSGGSFDVRLKEGDFGLANVAATVAELLGVEADEGWGESLIDNA
ncbi:2,3-bisphosphoglycerate-independent phosphoglycerate mutase [Candidatus Saccharibacteria bacterium]|nr:2,3-bisphosphoglycerate-independent phosphoglycerate mutase [Candidatus Saccharibacteria bacterium]